MCTNKPTTFNLTDLTLSLTLDTYIYNQKVCAAAYNMLSTTTTMLLSQLSLRYTFTHQTSNGHNSLHTCPLDIKQIATEGL